MNRMNLKGATPEAVTSVLILFAALTNAVLQMCGINILPVADEDTKTVISSACLIVTALWNTWKNRNITSAAQIAQDIADAIKSGRLLKEDVEKLMNQAGQRGDYI